MLTTPYSYKHGAARLKTRQKNRDSQERRKRLVIGFVKVLCTLLLIKEAIVSLPREITTRRRQKHAKSIKILCFTCIL